MTYKGDIDELLSAYIDEQLGTRQQTEVKRLLKHDPQIARRLKFLQNFRQILQAVPKECAPENTLEKIKQKLSESESTDISSKQYYDEYDGKKYLQLRKYAARAAMIILATVLVIVIYAIIAPPENKKVNISENWIDNKPLKIVPKTDRAESGTKVAADTENTTEIQRAFSGKLMLQTSEFQGVDAFIKKSLVDNGVMLIEPPITPEKISSYNIRCSKMKLSMVLADLSSIWNKFNSTELTIDTGSGETINIENILAQQIDQIAAEQTFDESIKVAKGIAKLNSLSSRLAPQAEYALSDPPIIDSIAIPKPILTGPDKNDVPKLDIDNNQLVELIIEVTATK